MLNELLPFLQQLAIEPVSVLHRKGYFHFSLMVLPRLQMAGKNKTFDHDLLAQCWTNVGAVYEMNKAPLRAELALKKAVMLFPNRIEALCKLMEVQLQTGKFNDAFVNVNKALDIEPDNMSLYTERQIIQDALNYRMEPLYSDGDPIWALNEALAVDKFDWVVNTVLESDLNNVPKLKCLARAYGGMAHYANYLRIWNTITEYEKNVVLEPADWFFLPAELQDSHVFAAVGGISNK